MNRISPDLSWTISELVCVLGEVCGSHKSSLGVDGPLGLTAVESGIPCAEPAGESRNEELLVLGSV